MKIRSLLPLLLTAALLLSDCGAGSTGTSAPAETTAETSVETTAESSVETGEAAPAETADDIEIRAAVLSGATGYGAAKLMSDCENGLSSVNCTFTVESSPKTIQDSLIAGEIDIGALSTNKAAMLSNASPDTVQVCAVNTLGVMYLVTADGSEISSFEDLRGLTVCIPLEPSYILEALCEANGLTVGEDVIIETYATPSDLLASVIKGEIPVAVLPEPLLTTAMAKQDSIQIMLNLTEEWDKVFTDSKLMQGCLVVRTEFAEAHPEALQNFLNEYKASIEYVSASPDEASAMVETYFGTAAAVAAKAIRNCSMTYIDGQEMKQLLTEFYGVLVDIESANIGGAVPAESFYYSAQ